MIHQHKQAASCTTNSSTSTKNSVPHLVILINKRTLKIPLAAMPSTTQTYFARAPSEGKFIEVDRIYTTGKYTFWYIQYK